MNRPRIEAKRWLDRAYAGDLDLTAEGWFDLVLAATGDRDAAEEAHNASVKRAYRSGRTPE